MKKITLSLSAALCAGALAMAGAAHAAPEVGKRGPDADGNGSVTRSEAQAHAAQMFARMDFNKDGQLNPADREGRWQERRNQAFAKLDADSNGQISRNEFMAKPERGPSAGPGMKGEKPGRPDGHRGHGRWGRGNMGHGGMGPGMMPGADADRNGAVSQAEFTAAALARFDRSDANKDGQVTKEERQAARSQMREQMRAKWRENNAGKTGS